MIFILCIPTALLSACSPSGMQGNPAAVQAGAAIGGVLGAIVGDRAGGYNGSQFGALLGTVTGAAVGNAITTPREETYQVEEYYVKTYPSSSQYEHTSSYEPSSGLRIINLREGGNLAASKIRNLECPSYEICLIDYGCGKFNRKIHIMEQYP